jgi:uncharacterized protein YegP (UPF0339 family)
MSGATAKYVVEEAKDGSFYYLLKAGNGEVLATSETYDTREHAEEGVEAAQRAGTEAE